MRDSAGSRGSQTIQSETVKRKYATVTDLQYKSIRIISVLLLAHQMCRSGNLRSDATTQGQAQPWADDF